jgi:hypothetical protein
MLMNYLQAGLWIKDRQSAKQHMDMFRGCIDFPINWIWYCGMTFTFLVSGRNLLFVVYPLKTIILIYHILLFLKGIQQTISICNDLVLSYLLEHLYLKDNRFGLQDV